MKPILTLLFALMLAPPTGLNAADPPRILKPNIIFILADDK